MHFKYLSILVSIIVLSQNLTAAEDNFFSQRDKQKHFIATTIISTAVTGYTRSQGYSKVESFFWGFGVAVAAGLLKEGLDGTNSGDQSFDDVKADLLGAIVGALISAQFEWKF
ncbi:MAG TPA: hypothetical protein EYH42_06480 [Sulfurovum sp.]|nr:hypothetical protein [Sulfurovum sp.]